MNQILFIISFFISFSSYQINQDINKKNIYERMKSKKNMVYDTINFNNFQEYLLFIPILELPSNINSYNGISYIPDTIRWYIQSTHCNYGPYPCNPIAKIEKEKFVSILYSGKTNGNELLLFNYDYKGNKIDSTEVFTWDGNGPIKEKCKTEIDTNLNISILYSAIQFNSYDVTDTFKITKISKKFRILESGKIEVLTNKTETILHKK